jgi:hypothetical protein
MSIYLDDIKLPSGNYGRKRQVSEVLDAMRWSAKHNPHLGTTVTDGGSSINGSWDFCKTENIDEAIDLIENGWNEAVIDHEGLDGLCTDTEESKIFTPDVGGAFPIVPAYIAGSPCSMWNLRARQDENKRGLTLVIEGSYLGNVGIDEITEYAHAVMRLCAWLAAERIESAVYVTGTSKLQGGVYTYCIPVRRAGDALAPERIAAALHPSFFRRGMFAMREREFYDLGWQSNRIVLNGYGRSQDTEEQDLRMLISEAYSIVKLPRIGRCRPKHALMQAVTMKLQQKDG